MFNILSSLRSLSMKIQEHVCFLIIFVYNIYLYKL